MSVVVYAAVIHGWCMVFGVLCVHCVSYTALVEEVVCRFTRRDRFPQTRKRCAGPFPIWEKNTLGLGLTEKKSRKQQRFWDLLLGDKALAPWRMKGRHPEADMNLPPAKRASFILECRAVSCIPGKHLQIRFYHTVSISGRKHQFIKGING